MPKKLETTNKEYSQFGSMKFDSIKLWISPNNKIFYIVKFGKNSVWISANLLEKIKQEAA